MPSPNHCHDDALVSYSSGRKVPSLSLRQIARLLRKSGKAKAKFHGSGSYTYNQWTLTEGPWDQACNGREEFCEA